MKKILYLVSVMMITYGVLPAVTYSTTAETEATITSTIEIQPMSWCFVLPINCG